LLLGRSERQIKAAAWHGANNMENNIQSKDARECSWVFGCPSLKDCHDSSKLQNAAVDAAKIDRALGDIADEKDPTVKNLKLASLCSEVFRERGIELVVVGGSAIEFYTEGAYTSGDVDLCVASTQEPLTVRLRQELMGQLRGQGGPRSWRVAGGFVDVLGDFENLAQTGLRTIAGPYGKVVLSPAEELVVERVLVSWYPAAYAPARECAAKLIAAGLRREYDIDWVEVLRIATRPEYGSAQQVKDLVYETAKALGKRSPYDSEG
jgi:hypothetical protein